jgi:hypothetical protein
MIYATGRMSLNTYKLTNPISGADINVLGRNCNINLSTAHLLQISATCARRDATLFLFFTVSQGAERSAIYMLLLS